VTDDTSSLKDDISFLRSLAEAGRNRPLVGGIGLVGAGTIFGGAAFLNWLEWSGLVELGLAPKWIWIGALVLFLVAGTVCIPMLRARNASANPSNHAFAMAWSGAGLGILVLFIVNIINVWRWHNQLVLTAQASTYICLYGVAWYVSAGLVKRRWFLGVALLSFAFAILFALLPFGPQQMLAFAIAIICTALIPGIYLMAQEPR
jgi:hypothetical protein